MKGGGGILVAAAAGAALLYSSSAQAQSGGAPAGFRAAVPGRGEPYVDALWAFGAELHGTLKLSQTEWACLGYGLMDRESLCGLLLSPKGPAGTGDGGHGHGLFQLDDRTHGAFIRTGGAYEPVRAARYAAANEVKPTVLVLEKLLGRTLDGTRELDLRCVLAGYNARDENVAKVVKAGQDPDVVTTGKDYSYDVLKRARPLLAAMGGVA